MVSTADFIEQGPGDFWVVILGIFGNEFGTQMRALSDEATGCERGVNLLEGGQAATGLEKTIVVVFDFRKRGNVVAACI